MRVWFVVVVCFWFGRCIRRFYCDCGLCWCVDLRVLIGWLFGLWLG